jgi:hypothetical protein
MKIFLVLMCLICQLFCYWILVYFLPICKEQYESHCAWKHYPITHPIHLLSCLKFGGKNPVTWLQSRIGAVVHSRTQTMEFSFMWSKSCYLLVWMRSFILVKLHDGDGGLVPNNSQDLTSLEGVTYTSQCIFFFLCFSIQYLFCFAFSRKFSNYVS